MDIKIPQINYIKSLYSGLAVRQTKSIKMMDIKIIEDKIKNIEDIEENNKFISDFYIKTSEWI